MRKKGYLIVLCILLVFICSACKKEAEVVEPVKEEETKTEDAKEKEAVISEDAQALVDAVTATSELPSFEMPSDIQLNLNGNYIQLSANIHTDTEIVQGQNTDDLQMSSVTTTDQDDLTSYAYYKDGVYYLDDQNGRTSQEKSPDEVMAMVTDITRMVTDAADKIENLNVTEEGENKVYSYTVPPYLAESYLKELAESEAADDTPLKGAKADVEQLDMITTIGPDGLVVKQEATMAGTIKKSIFKIPADAVVAATFHKTEKTTLDIQTW